MDGKASDWRPGPTVCRCCLTEGCYKDISTEYFWMGKREVYSEMLSETLNVSIAYSQSGGPNSNSRLICEPCISRLRDATEFKRQVIDCEKTFMNYIDGGSASSSKMTVETIGEVKVEIVKREKESLSDDDFDDRPDFLDVDDDDDDLDDQPLTKLATKVPKKEAVDLLDLLDNSQITVKRKPALKIKDAPPAKKVKKKEIVSKPSASKVAAMKKNEKKKDEWTTTDFSEPIDIRLEYLNDDQNLTSVPKRNTPEDNEWIVMDFMDLMPKTMHMQLDADLNMNSRSAKEDKRHRGEWTTVPLRTTATPRIVYSSVPQTKYKPVISHNKRIETQSLTQKTSTSQTKFRNPPISVEECLNIENARLILENTTAIPHKISLKILGIQCYACSSRFDDPAKLRDHCLTEHMNDDKTQDMNLKIQTRVDITELNCAICAEPFDSLEEVAQHLVQEHELNINLEERLGLVPLKFKRSDALICCVCEKKCPTYRDLYRHTGLHYYLHVCEICGKKFESIQSFRVHKSTTHVEGFACKRCKAVFSTQVMLKQHVRDSEKCHHGRCKICNLTFRYSVSMQKHREEVHGAPKRIYKCSECSNVFETNVKLYTHFKKEHTDDYKCAECGKTFGTSKCLRKHSTVHTVDRPHICSVCQQSFKSIFNMRRHVTKNH